MYIRLGGGNSAGFVHMCRFLVANSDNIPRFAKGYRSIPDLTPEHTFFGSRWCPRGFWTDPVEVSARVEVLNFVDEF